MYQEPRICQVIAAGTADEARPLLAAPPPGVDLLELRIDLLAKAERTAAGVAELVAGAALPVIATCRPGAERGGHPDDDPAREALLTAALDAGARFVDLEWSWWRRDPALRGRVPRERILLSHHEWESTPPDLEARFEALLSEPAAAWKLAVQVEEFDAALRLVSLAGEAARRGQPVACFALGPVGRVTRVLSARAGAWLTYVAPDDGPAPAGDLLTVSEALQLYALKSTPPDAKLLGVLGQPARRSLSPQMHNHVIRRLGERYLYLPFDAPTARPVLEYMRRGELRGLSVTQPHKQAVLPLLDTLDADAAAVGAVNTIVRRGARLVGYNTDVVAARHVLGHWGSGPATRAVVLGAGGAARAVLAALRELGAPTIVINRDEARGRAVALEFGAAYGGTTPAAAHGGEPALLINATPLGAGDETIPGLPRFAPGMAVLDLAYRRGPTPLELAARRSGARVAGGLEFLARQAAGQFTLWTGRRVPVELYLQALRSVVPGAVDALPPAAAREAGAGC